MSGLPPPDVLDPLYALLVVFGYNSDVVGSIMTG